ncbi:MAG TPA: LysR substrate-binding domain-containing protein [Actinospica sp.]|nr:LysR substrate-binding domain-containing protein [Actinospica sp.]
MIAKSDSPAALLDPVHLRTFLTVAQTLSFTAAAQRLGTGQSTVSQHVRKLEAAVGRPLLERDTHSVTLTADGTAMLGFARDILDSNEHAVDYFAGPALRGRVRLGASEDFAYSRLPDILRSFRATHPLVELELTVGLSGVLHRALEARQLDLVMAKRKTGETHGTLVSRDTMAWIAAPGFRLSADPSEPVPLIACPEPSISRELAIRALERAGRPWRSACTAGSFSGLHTAARAGLGVTAHTRSLIPAGLAELPRDAGLPALGEVEFVLLARGRGETGPGAALRRAILASEAQPEPPNA